MPENNNVISISEVEEQQEVSLNIEVTEEKPFNKCLSCEYLGNGCSGPNLNAMTVERACEFLQMRRLQLGYTYQKVADITMLSLVTIKRILTGKVKDPSFLSMQMLTFALVSDPKGKYPCAMHLISDETEKAIEECKAAKEELALKEKQFNTSLQSEREKVEFLKQQIKFKEEQMLAKDVQIKERGQILEDRRIFLKKKDATIIILTVALALCLLTIIAALVIDRLNSDIGFFWLDSVASWFDGATGGKLL